MEKKDSEALALNGHYADTAIDTIDVAEAWNLDPFLFSALKYIQRRGNKRGDTLAMDMAKAIWYLSYYLTRQKWIANHMAEELMKCRSSMKECDKDV